MSIITSIELGLTSTGRLPYAIAKLDCGHYVEVDVRPSRGQCGKCGHVLDLPTGQRTVCVCGSKYFLILKPYPNPHLEADRLTKPGQIVDCKACTREAEQIVWLKSLVPGSVHHSRADRYNRGSIHLYRHDPTSPSGFFLMGSVADTPQTEAILRTLRAVPLSPTEPA